MNKVLITGGNGFIGSNIIKELLNHNYKITCLIRENAKRDLLKDLKIEYIVGDITDEKSIEDAMKDIDIVIHNAAYAKDWGSYKNFYDINVEGTLNVLKACKRKNISQIIYTGTNSVYGEEDNLIIKDETTPHNSHYNYFFDKKFPCVMNYYRDTKTIAKEKAIEYSNDNNLNLTIIEPVWVYGEGELYGGFYEYVRTAQDNILIMPGSKKNKFHTIYVKDLAKAYRLSIEKRIKGVESFIIADEKTEYMDKIYNMFCEVAGFAKPMNMPKWLIYPIGFLLEAICTLMKTKYPPQLTRARVNMFYDNNEFSSKKAQNILGFKTDYTLKEGIKNTIKWYQENKYLKKSK